MAKPKWRNLDELKTDSVVPWKRKNLFRCDPYLVWADATTKLAPEPALEIAVLVELVASDDLPGLIQRLNRDGTEREKLHFLPNGFEPVPASRFITGLVDRRGLAALIAEVLDGSVERFTLQDSRKDIAQACLGAYPGDIKSLEPSEAPPSDASGPGTYLGIVDDGLPVLRARDAVQWFGRVAHFWDQGWLPPHLSNGHGKPSDPQPDDRYWRLCWDFVFIPLGDGNVLLEPPRGFLYGRRMKRLDDGSGQNDRDEYFLSRYYSPPPRHTHGAAVLGLLAPWLSEARGPLQWPTDISGLAMVQLPSGTVHDTSGGSLAMRVIDGLRYIVWQEERDAAGKATDRHIVANVSYGTHAGPHDGTSMFERALAEMLDNHPRLHVVLPVGNAARVGCHARRALARHGEAGDAASILMQVLPDNGRDTFVEFWLPRGARIELGIRPPGSDVTYDIREGQAKIHFVPSPTDTEVPRRVHFGAVYSKEVAQGTQGPMALLAIAPTRHAHHSTAVDARGLNQQPRRELLGMPGLWELTVRNLGNEPVALDAWIERANAAPDVSQASRQAYFPDSCCEEVALHNAMPTGTLNGIATFQHHRLHVVGAMRANGVLSAYSAAGRGRPPGARAGPDVVVPADWSFAVPGLRTTGFVKGAITRINGTSAACAVYARALAKQLARDPTQPPCGEEPGPAAPEVSCAAEWQAEADPCLRGQGRREMFCFDVDL